MAISLDKAQLKKTPVIPYEKIRDYLKTGDIFFSSGSYAFSGVIQKLTKSTWSHVAVIYKDEELGRILVLEAEPSVGIRLMPLSKYLKDYKGTKRPYKGQVVIASLNKEIQKEQLNKGICFGLDELTRPYDNYEIVRIMTRILFHISKRDRNRNYICSELVRDIFAKAGVVMQYKDTYISPDNIWTDERVEMSTEYYKHICYSYKVYFFISKAFRVQSQSFLKSFRWEQLCYLFELIMNCCK